MMVERAGGVRERKALVDIRGRERLRTKTFRIQVNKGDLGVEYFNRSRE